MYVYVKLFIIKHLSKYSIDYFYTNVLFFVLQELFISKIQIDYFDDLALRAFLSLEKLTLNMANLLEAPSLPENKCYLTSLDLDHNAIVVLPGNYFEGCHVLKRLRLGYNKLISMPELSYLKNTLNFLHLENNSISGCGSLCENPSVNDLFASTKFISLKTISLHSNNISDMNLVHSLPLWPSVYIVDVSNNQLTTLSDIRKSRVIGNLTVVYLKAQDNPYHCNASMAWLTEVGRTAFLNQNNFQLGRVKIYRQNFDEMLCSTPSDLYGFPIWKLSMWIVFYTQCF